MRINVEITGMTPLLMNRFNVDEYSTKVKDKNLTPREEALKAAHIDESGKLFLPTQNIYSAIIEAGKFHKDGKVKVTTAKSSLIPAGVMMVGIRAYFSEPQDFEVDIRHVVLPSTGGAIMKYRPRLDEWKIPFEITLDTKMFTPKMVRTLVDDAGSKIGLGSFRPSRKGIYGRFVVTKWEEEN